MYLTPPLFTYQGVNTKYTTHLCLGIVPYRCDRRFDPGSILQRLLRVAATTEARTKGFIIIQGVGFRQYLTWA
jgi:hypothetical protein